MSVLATPSRSPAHAWMRALELTSSIKKKRYRTLPVVIKEVAQVRDDALALLSDSESMTYRQLAQRIGQYADWAVAHGLHKGDVVGLLGAGGAEYLAVWLGLVSVGVVVSLLNTTLVGASLAHSIAIAPPKLMLADPECKAALDMALHLLPDDKRPRVQVLPLNNLEANSFRGKESHERSDVALDDLALLVFTSGTTGLPKAAKITHARLLQWSCWFSGLMQVEPWDRMYSCLPMYHSVGGVQVPGAMLVAGATLVIREKFSARVFWEDIVRWDCTLFQYIGELCRYLLYAPSSPWERRHRLRLACGNGLAPDIWEQFQARFALPQILEFYASTEGNVSLFNVEGKPGAVGQVPRYLEHRFSPPLVQSDPETNQPVRGKDTFCRRCGPDQVGEALGSLAQGRQAESGFDGYTDDSATQAKILRDVFEHGDAWFRTGDLFRRDQAGAYYFVDRIGETFRRKGENVATAEVEAALCRVSGVRHAVAYGVPVPHVDGRVGMAALAVDACFDLSRLKDELRNSLPAHACPVFLRMQGSPPLTGTWKYSKTELVREGFNPEIIRDPLYIDLLHATGYIPLDIEMYRSLHTGAIRI